MELHNIPLEIPADSNIIFGQSHFIKTVEDLAEAMVTAAPGIKFGLAFCEASQDRLIRHDGNDDDLRQAAIRNAQVVAAGHTFIIVMRNAFPINVMHAVKACQEVCTIFCATANPVEAVVAETSAGRGVLGVIDGETPMGVENDEHIAIRKDFLRKIQYKR
jgi:adenosine/AMP kinase